MAASAAPSACAPLSPILLPYRCSVARDALLPTPSARCAAPAAVIPQFPRFRLVAASAAPSACAPLSPILLLHRSSVARDALLPTPSARCAAPAAVIPQSPRSRLVRVLLSDSASPSSRQRSSPMEVYVRLSSVRVVSLSRSRRTLCSQEGTSSFRMLGASETAAAAVGFPFLLVDLPPAAPVTLDFDWRYREAAGGRRHS